MTDLIDVIPIFGPLINNLLDLAGDMAVKGDYDDILGFIGDPDFQVRVQCQLYCRLKELTTYGSAELYTIAGEVVAWAVRLPAGLPLLTFYGPAFGLWLAAVDAASLWRHAFIYLDERSNDCALLCVDDCPQEWCYTFDFTTSDGGWARVPGTTFGVWTTGVGWQGNKSGSVYAIYIGRSFTTSVITSVEMLVDVPGGLNADSDWNINVGGNVQSGVLAVGTNTCTWSGSVSAGNIKINPNDTAQNLTVIRVTVRGIGVNPFGTDNCPPAA